MRPEITTIVLTVLAIALAVVAYLKDPNRSSRVISDARAASAASSSPPRPAWEAPLMGWRFVAVRVLPSLAFPVIAGWLVKTFYHD